MPTWGQILSELQEKAKSKPGTIPCDEIRRNYLAALQAHTKRDVILYETDWTSPNSDPSLISINEEDLQGLMEVIHGLKGPNLDLILHSPGGSPDCTGALVSYLRSKFSHIRVIVSQAAMSAATMLACACDEIVMGKHSFIGPIDPQFILQTKLGRRAVPAQAIIDQFEMAKQECKDSSGLATWLPILEQYGPALLIECNEATKLSEELVSEWLEKYMFKGDAGKKKTAQKIAMSLLNHKELKSHGRRINRDWAKEIGLKITDLEEDQLFQDLSLSVHHATIHTFGMTPAAKIIENHLGKAYMKFDPRRMARTMVKVSEPPQQFVIPDEQQTAN